MHLWKITVKNNRTVNRTDRTQWYSIYTLIPFKIHSNKTVFIKLYATCYELFMQTCIYIA